MNSNIDKNELDKFKALANYWWDDNGPLQTLHLINPLRLQFITEKIALRDKSVIDVGCGGGILTESLAQQGAFVTGIDMNQTLIDTAKLHQRKNNLKIEYLTITAENMAKERSEQYDVVTCMELLEHVPDAPSILNACYRLLKPDGMAFFSTINRNLKSYLLAIIGAEYILKLLPPGTHCYDKFIKPSELSDWSREANLTPLGFQGFSYSPFKKEAKFSENVDINYLFYAKKER